MKNTKRWRIEQIRPGQSILTQLIDISSNPTQSQAEFSIKECWLEFGYYKFTFEVTFANGLLDSEYTYVQVVSSGLLILATENGLNEIQRGYQQSVVLDPVKYSIDYDKSVIFSELNFKFFCRILYSSDENISYPTINGSLIDLMTFQNFQGIIDLNTVNQSCFSSNGNFFLKIHCLVNDFQ